MGAWIETMLEDNPTLAYQVAPHVGAWIETPEQFDVGQQFTSHPMWVRGLKLERLNSYYYVISRTPCGCVD